MTRLRGYRPDPHDVRARYGKFAHHFGIAAAPQPRDLRTFAPRVLDQGSCSGCVGHGTATGIATAAAVAGEPLGFVPSPLAIYANAVALERAQGASIDTPLADAGSYPALAMQGLVDFGVRPMAGDADGALTDCPQGAATLPEPDLDDLEREGPHVYVGWYALANADEARAAIAAGAPVGVGTFVDSRFEDWHAGLPALGTMNVQDPNGGGHWMCLLGWKARLGGLFVLRNSWGPSWGDAGDCLVTDAFVNQADQLIAFGWRAS